MGRKPMLVFKIPLDIAEQIVKSLQEQIDIKNGKSQSKTIPDKKQDEDLYIKFNKVLSDLWIKKCWIDSELICKSFYHSLNELGRKGLDSTWFDIQRRIIAKTLHAYPEIKKDTWINSIKFFTEDPWFSKHMMSFSVIVKNFHRYIESNKTCISDGVYLKFKSQVV